MQEDLTVFLRWYKNEQDDNARESSKALRLAFKHEVHPKDYFLRVWITSLVACVFFAYGQATQSISFDSSALFPPGGHWQSHDPTGRLYLQTWSTILINSLQTGFAVWGIVLLLLGIFRIFSSHKYVFACFYLGFAFMGFCIVLPGWTETLLNLLIDKCPVLVQ